MKVLLAYPYLPHPGVAHGSGRLLVPLLERWRGRAEITLVCGFRPGEARYIPAAGALVHEIIPVPRPLRADLSPLLRVAESARTAILTALRRDPLHVTKLDRANVRAAIRGVRTRERFDVAQIELAGFARCVEELDGIPAVLVDHEAGAASGGDVAADPAAARYVRALYPRFRAIGTLCAEDGADLRALVPQCRFVVRRPGVSVIEPGPRPTAAGDRRVLFFGSPEHQPNLDAIRWLAADLWPRIAAAAPGASCVIAGGALPDDVTRAAASAGIVSVGFVPDMNAELAAASVVVAPIRIGRGVRMKNLDALGAGRPLVTTTLGARGLDLRPGVHAIVADDSDAFASAVVTLLGDPERAERIGAVGRVHASAHFSHAAAADANFDLWRELASA